MGVQEEILRIRQEIVGDEQLKRLTALYETHEAEVRRLARAYDAGAISEAQFNAQSASHVAAMRNVGRQMDALNRTAGRGSGGLANTLTQLSYAADDAQYGFRGLSNNIAPLLSQFGVWGSVIAIGAVGLYQFNEHSRALTHNLRPDLIDRMAGSTEKLTKRMEDLKKETYLTQSEMKELNNLQIEVAGREAAKKDAGTATKRQADVKAAYQEALAEDKGYQSVENAAFSTVSKPFLDRPEEAIKQAASQGMLKDDQGKAVKIDPQRWGWNKAYMDSLKRQYLDSVIPVLKQDLLKRIGTEGDEQAIEELKRGMDATGLYNTDEDGNVTGPNGKTIKPLSALMRGAPEIRKRRERKEQDVEDVAAMKGEQQTAFENQVGEVAKVVRNRVGAAIANGMKGDELEKFTAEVMQLAFPDKTFGGRKGPGVWAHAVSEQVRKDINAEVSTMLGGNNIRPLDAKAIVARDLNANANKIPTEVNDKNREADAKTAEEQDKAKQERDQALSGGISEGLQGDIMSGLLANRQMALPGNKSTARQKARQRDDLARFTARIIEQVRRELIQGGMDPGQAEQLAGKAPEYFKEQFNAWRLRQIAPGGGGVADPQRNRADPRQRNGGFRSVGVEDNQMTQAQLTAQSFQNQAELANRQIAIEQELRAARQQNNVFHQRQRTAQMWGR